MLAMRRTGERSQRQSETLVSRWWSGAKIDEATLVACPGIVCAAAGREDALSSNIFIAGVAAAKMEGKRVEVKYMDKV